MEFGIENSLLKCVIWDNLTVEDLQSTTEEEGTATKSAITLPSSLGEASPSFPSTSSSSSSIKRRKDAAILHRLLLRPLEGPAD
ncbi:UNVERIFIED_CONTAM: hypothetical protein Sradi_7292300 [Sesamum radiatum]|uniref:Uncharacterized protein n=1 Tax=Sesamum radiatum TaxID=300843 RepID=A0AAW2IHR1_SESRA